MIHPDEALRIILASVGRLDPCERALAQAENQYLATDVVAACDLPPFDNSAMDGYAMRAADAASVPAQLPVLRTIAAGAAPGAPLHGGGAVRIMTGAPVPPGADTVVMRELTEELGEQVRVLEAPAPHQHIRRRGEDVRSGAALLSSGTRLRPQEIALLAAQGYAKVRVVASPRVALFTTGDELVDCGETPGPGQIRDSSTPALAALLRRWGFSAHTAPRVKDSVEALTAAVAAALREHDALFITGGVSVGDYDYTRKALAQLGFEELLWRVKIRPGKPLLFGRIGNKPVFGLPGNPISTLVTAEVFARPALEKMGGCPTPPDPFPERGILGESFAKPEHLRHFLFCSAERSPAGTTLRVIEPQGSALLAMASRAQALAVGPIGVARLERGMEMAFKWL